MKNSLKYLLTLFLASTNSACTSQKPFEVDYSNLILLDAESLSEQGILVAYESIKPLLAKYTEKIEHIEEMVDNDLPNYKVKFRGEVHEVYGPHTNHKKGESWGNATYVLFHIINSQLKNSDTKLYAVNGGNDLGGMFLTNSEYIEANKSIQRASDKFYLPTPEQP